jgi:hypothetical protein
MSTKIKKINRGDSFEFVTTIPDKKDPSKNYILKATDALYFALLFPHQPFGDVHAPIIRGYSGTDEEVNKITGEITIKLSHSDTKHLVPGIYYYTTKLQIGGSLEDLGATEEPEEVRTIIERTKFIVNE